jgi:hypothetical protein
VLDRVEPSTHGAEVADALQALEGLLADGGDPPEGQLVAVYRAVFPPPVFRDGDPTCPAGFSGPALGCMEDEVPRVLAMVTDAPFHHGPGDSAPYEVPPFGDGYPFGWDVVVERLRTLRARVVGASTRGDHGGRDLTALVEASGALGLDGRPLARGATDPSGVADALREVLARWRAEVPYDVVVHARVVEGEPGVLRGFRLVEVTPPPGALPPTGATDERAWRVAPGSTVRVALEVDRSEVPVGRAAAIELRFRDDDRLRLGALRLPVARPLAPPPGARPDASGGAASRAAGD